MATTPQAHLNTQYAWYDPRRYELTLSERLQAALNPNSALADSRGSQLNPLSGGPTPVAPNDTRNISGVEREWAGGPDQINTGYGQSGYDAAKALSVSNPSNTDRSADPGAGYFWDAADGWKQAGGGGGGGASSTTLEMLQRERDRQLGFLEDDYRIAQKYGADAMKALEGRRAGFQEDFSGKEADIFNQFGRNRADLQVGSEGQDARTTRGLLAQGVGGSGLQEALRRNEASRQQNYGQVREGRQTDDRANTANLNERMRWADSEEANVNRYIENAGTALSRGRQTTLDNFTNTIGGLIAQAQAAAQALSASGSRIGSTQIAGVPLAGLESGTFLNDLQQAYQMATGGGQAANANVNMNLEGQSLTEQDLRRRGLLN